LEEILTAIGPLDLPAYAEQITAKNIKEKVYLRANSDLDVKLGKDSYFTSLFKQILSKLAEKNTAAKIISLLPQLAKEKQVFINVAISDLFDNLSWSGKLSEPLCPPPFDQSCQMDSIFQTETNISANYSNYSIERSIYHSIVLGQNTVQHSRRIVFKNNSSSASWPGGNYRSYLRFAVDKDSKLEGIQLAGKQLSQDQIITSTEHNKKIWGIDLELPPLAEKELIIKYQVPLKNQLAYGFFDQKQAGIDNDSLVLELTYPSTLSPAIIAPQAEVLGNKLRFSLLRNGDSPVLVKFK
jgi:hypothetical protein